jgi:hypothetical protein
VSFTLTPGMMTQWTLSLSVAFGLTTMANLPSQALKFIVTHICDIIMRGQLKNEWRCTMVNPINFDNLEQV